MQGYHTDFYYARGRSVKMTPRSEQVIFASGNRHVQKLKRTRKYILYIHFVCPRVYFISRPRMSFGSIKKNKIYVLPRNTGLESQPWTTLAKQICYNCVVALGLSKSTSSVAVGQPIT